MRKIIEKIEHDQYSQRIFRTFRNVYLVGGFVRDALLRRAALDRDYAVKGDPLKAAKRVQKIFPGKIVQFRDNLTVRIALKCGGNIDFTRLSGSIEQDLSERDFSINAMAYSQKEGLIDPLGGKWDLINKYIRTTRNENLINDPIRILRAFRFKSELGYEIEKETMKGILCYCGLISQASSERITFEFIQLMDGKAFIQALLGALKCGLLKNILFINNSKINININNMVQLNEFLRLSHYKRFLNEIVSQGITKRVMLLLTALLHNVNISSSLLLFNNNFIDFKRNAERYSAYRKKGWLTNKRMFELFEAMKDHHKELGIYAKEKDLLLKARKYLHIKKKSLVGGHEVCKDYGFLWCEAWESHKRASNRMV